MYKFKKSKVKGKEYLQIWKEGEFIKTVGSAESLLKKLVRLEELEKKTNLIKEKLTNLAEGKLNEKD